MASPVGKHSASGEARYSVTPFKEAETDLPPEAYAAFRRYTAALDPHAIADACRNLLEKAVHLHPPLHDRYGMDGFHGLLEKLQNHLAGFQAQA